MCVVHYYLEFWSSFENLKICVVSYHMLHGVFGLCLKMLKYVLFHTIYYMEFWSLFENAKICAFSHYTKQFLTS